MNSCLYECAVFHRRLEPKPHEFQYRVFYFLIDLDELSQIDASMRMLKVNRPGLYSFREGDHITHGGASIRENVDLYLKKQGIEQPAGRIMLLTLPRVLGYIFNPISIYFCFDATGEPLASVAEVGNTFGEWKPYLVPPSPDGSFHARVAKNFYVSPFSELNISFDFRFDVPGKRLKILIDDYNGDRRTLMSSLTGKRLPLSDAVLLGFSFKYPLITLRVILGIHWHALLLWLKGLDAHQKEANPGLQLGVHRPHKSLANHPESCAHSEPDDSSK